MKVIASIGSGKFICEVEETEVQMFLNTYFSRESRLKIGREIDLGAGYKFHKDTINAL